MRDKFDLPDDVVCNITLEGTDVGTHGDGSDDGSDEGFIVEGIKLIEGMDEGTHGDGSVEGFIVEGFIVGIKLIEGIIVGSWVHMYVGKKLGASEYPPV